MPDKNINRKGMVSSRDNAKLVYQAAKKSLMGDKLSKQIVTAADDKAAAEVFYWGLIYGEQGVADGSMPTGMADMDIRRKPKPKLKNWTPLPLPSALGKGGAILLKSEKCDYSAKSR